MNPFPVCRLLHTYKTVRPNNMVIQGALIYYYIWLIFHLIYYFSHVHAGEQRMISLECNLWWPVVANINEHLALIRCRSDFKSEECYTVYE